MGERSMEIRSINKKYWIGSNNIFGTDGKSKGICCKNCGSAVPARNIDLNGQIAKCDHCNSVFNCKDELSKISDNTRDEIKLPEGIKIKRDISGLNIERRWLNSKYIFLAFFTVLYGLYFFDYLTSPAPASYRITSPPSVQALAGVALTYIVLSGCINKTRIIIDPKSLIIKHGPIPAWGNKDLNAGELKQLYSLERVGHTKKGGRNYSYELHAETKSGRDIKLLSGLENMEQVLYIEQEIEKYLRIKDEHVIGEIPR